MKRMAVISAGFVPVPAVDGGAGEVLTTQLIAGNEKYQDYYMDIYTIESPKLNEIHYQNAEIIQLHITKWNWFICKARNAFLKLFHFKFRFIPYNRILLKKFRDNYDVILIENNMQVYEDIYKHAKNGTEQMVFHMHNDIDGTTKPEYLVKLIGKTARLILPVSNYIKNRFLAVWPNHVTEVFYNCVDTHIFNPNNIKNTEELRAQYGLFKDDFVFLFAGSVYPGKGVLELLQAFKKVRIDCKNVKLMIVGSRWYNVIEKDKYFDLLKEESEDCKEDIVFTGYVYPEKMPEIYTLGDVMVIPSICEEAFPLVALEAMAMKKAIISTNSGGITESLIADQVAIIVEKEEQVVEKLADAMKHMYYDETLRERLRENAYYEVHTNPAYDIDQYYSNFRNILDRYIDIPEELV